MKVEEKLYLIDEILRCYYESITDREIGYKDGMIDAIDTILHFDNEEEENK